MTSDLSQIRKYEDLPDAAKAYIEFIEQQTGVPVVMIGVGAGREDASSAACKMNNVFKVCRTRRGVSGVL